MSSSVDSYRFKSSSLYTFRKINTTTFVARIGEAYAVLFSPQEDWKFLKVLEKDILFPASLNTFYPIYLVTVGFSYIG